MTTEKRCELELIRFRKANTKRLTHLSRNAKSRRIRNKANRLITEMAPRAFVAAAFLYIKRNNQAALP